MPANPIVRRHRAAALPLVVLSVVALAACGGSGGTDGSEATASGSTTAPAAAGVVTTEPIGVAVTTALPEVNILTDFADVCRGVALPGATAYEPARTGIHPVMYAVGAHPEYDDVISTMPEQWNPATGSESTTELVACLARTSETRVETCDGYQDDNGVDTGNTVEMYDASYDIRLVAATTGDEIATTTLDATSGDCPSLFFFDEGESVGVEYALPSDALTAWMAEYVQI